MKKVIILLTVLVSLISLKGIRAEESSSPLPNGQELQQLSLNEVKLKIRQKESFYLFVGRMDNVNAQLAMAQLLQVQELTGKEVYHLDTKGIETRPYRAFSRKYAIRSAAYLSHFENRQQVSVYHNDWRADVTDLIAYLEQE
ncbi:hypothetical protein ACVRYP_05915 [Streptococcus rifensis]